MDVERPNTPLKVEGTARGTPVVAVRTDFRGAGDDAGWNLMIRRSATATVEHSADEEIEPVVDEVLQALRRLR